MTVLNLQVEKITDGSHKERLKSFHRTASHAVRGSNPVLCHKRPFVLVHKFEKGSSRKHNISSHCQDHSGYASSVEGIPAGRNFHPSRRSGSVKQKYGVRYREIGLGGRDKFLRSKNFNWTRPPSLDPGCSRKQTFTTDLIWDSDFPRSEI